MTSAQRFLSILIPGLMLCTALLLGASGVQAANCSITTVPSPANITAGGSVDFSGSVGGKPPTTLSWTFPGGSPNASNLAQVTVTYNTAGDYVATLDGTDGKGGSCQDTVPVTVSTGGGPGNQAPVLDPIGDKSVLLGNDLTFTVTASDDGLPTGTLTLSAGNLPNGATFSDNGDGTGNFEWLNAGPVGSTDTTFTASDGTLQDSEQITITVNDTLPPQTFAPQTDFKILMNYELGMHCTGFEFAYCCVLPVYNSIIAQVVKPNLATGQGGSAVNGSEFPRLLEGDPNVGLDALGRETVVRDRVLDASGNFQKYVVKYWHEAQERNDGRGKAQTSRLISAAEGNSLQSWNTTFDSAALNPDGSFVTGTYNGAEGVVLGNNVLGEPADNYQNAIWNHLYIYNGLEGDFACSAPVANQGNRCAADADCDTTTGSGDGVCNITSDEDQKVRLGVNGMVVYPPDCGAALHPLGPVTQGGNPANPVVPNDCGGFANGNVLTFTGDKGTVVYTQMKVLENLPVTLTSPRIWEALGLPLTPFEDSIDFFADPGLVDEDSIRPFVAMKAQLYEYDGGSNDVPVLDGNGDPVVGFGTAPIDIPNCERCHSNGPDGTVIQNSTAEGGGTLIVDNSPNNDPAQDVLVQAEISFWNAYYNIDTVAGDSNWYSRLKGAAISMLSAHDTQHGTSFTVNYPGCGSLMDPTDTTGCGATPQNTRLGNESVICQRCHADNVIAVVKSTTCGPDNELGTQPCTAGTLIEPITEAVHNNHRSVSTGGTIAFSDSLGRDGSCQGCHPAHRSNGDMLGYPITLAGTNLYAGGDNRGASGGCFVGRDVHSNPGKDSDGAETPEHLNAVGQWLSSNVFSNQGANGDLGIWCTNCHSQLGQELWKAEDMQDLVHGVGANNIRAASLQGIADQVAGGDVNQVTSWLDPKNTNAVDHTYSIWDSDPGLCDYVDNELATVLGGGIPSNTAHDANVATIEVHLPGDACSAGYMDGPNLATAFGCGTPATLCGTFDGDGDFSVHILDFCTTPDCVATAQGSLTSSLAVPVPFSAATDGRDHWLAGGEPHCADCHAAPYVEQSGNIDFFPPFNYPNKVSLMRYSRGHQDITCQGCHESIHGLYPVTPGIDTTSYAQAAALNADGSHGPLKCGTCHAVDRNGIPEWMSGVKYNGNRIRTYDDAVSWAHTFTAEVSPLEPDGVCQNCHGDRSGNISETSGKWLRHSFVGRVGRDIQDKAEMAALGDVAGGGFVDADDLNGLHDTVCVSCHTLQGGPSGNFLTLATCSNTTWKSHNIDGRLSEKVWEYVSRKENSGSTCGW